MWPTYAVDWRIGRTLYHIIVTNPEHRCRGVQSVELDGVPIDPRAIPLRNDGATHDVAVVLGKPRTIGISAEAAGYLTQRLPES
jgi:hypothetical protein